MRIVFIEIDTERAWAAAAIGPGYLAAYLRAHGHAVELVRAPLGCSAAELVSEVDAADLIGVSLASRQWLRARQLIAELRALVDIPVVAGGLHPTFAPEAVLASPGFDYVCLGEGEAALLELVDALAARRQPTGIANIWARGEARPELRPPFTPLDDLPFLARDLLGEYPGVVHMITQRGCPFRCTYCAARMYNQLYAATGSDYGRRRSQANVVAELAALKRSGALAYVIFLDDTFTINHGWVRDFCALFAAEIAVPFSIHARVETVNPGLLAELEHAGCQQITYGVESGSYRVRHDIMKRKVDNQRFRDVFAWSRDAGLMVTANYMLGLPGETRADLQMTLDLATELEVLDFGYFVYYPYPGTYLHELCREQGYLPADYLERPALHRESILDLPTLSKDDIGEYYDRFTGLRRQRYRQRLGPNASEADIDAALGHIDTNADAG